MGRIISLVSKELSGRKILPRHLWNEKPYFVLQQYAVKIIKNFLFYFLLYIFFFFNGLKFSLHKILLIFAMIVNIIFILIPIYTWNFICYRYLQFYRTYVLNRAPYFFLAFFYYYFLPFFLNYYTRRTCRSLKSR